MTDKPSTLNEAISRMFSAEKRVIELQNDVSRFERRRADMKREAGYPDNISFDVVWLDALRALKKSRGEI